MNKGVRFLKKLWCSVSGVVKYKDCFFSKVYRKDWPAWGIEKLVVLSTSPRQSESEDYGLCDVYN